MTRYQKTKARCTARYQKTKKGKLKRARYTKSKEGKLAKARCSARYREKHKLACCMRSRMYIALKSQDFTKDKHTEEYLDCSFKYLSKYLEKSFTAGMTWENYGKWHVDHRRCIASFNLKTSEEERYMCLHYTNLQPMWGPENLSKGATYDADTFQYKWKGREVGWVKI
jgi:hypothetical protein